MLLLDANLVERVIIRYKSFIIIGTLLNLLFDSKFEILDSQKGRMQTTKGIWMSKNGNGSILIFDIEGTDSKERGEQRMVLTFIIRNLSFVDIRTDYFTIRFSYCRCPYY